MNWKVNGAKFPKNVKLGLWGWNGSYFSIIHSLEVQWGCPSGVTLRRWPLSASLCDVETQLDCWLSVPQPIMRLIVLCVYIALAPSPSWTLTEGLLLTWGQCVSWTRSSVCRPLCLCVHLTQTLQEPWNAVLQAGKPSKVTASNPASVLASCCSSGNSRGGLSLQNQGVR